MWLCTAVIVTLVMPGMVVELPMSTFSTAATSLSLSAKSPITVTLPVVALTCVVVALVAVAFVVVAFGNAINSNDVPIETKLLRTIPGASAEVMFTSFLGTKTSTTSPLRAVPFSCAPIKVALRAVCGVIAALLLLMVVFVVTLLMFAKIVERLPIVCQCRN